MAQQCGPPGRNVTHDGCPLVPWEAAVVDALYPGCTWPDAPTMVNVGANKGYGVAEFLQLWQGARPQPSSPRPLRSNGALAAQPEAVEA